MTLLSIIVPVFRVEAYIEKCLTSIVYAESFKEECELIVIDDGSPDKSMDIVDRLTCGFFNIKIIRQHNQGLSMARNAGMFQACGEYIWFVDSDDWLPAGAIQKILSEISASEKPDIINIDFVMADGTRSSVHNNAKPGKIYSGLEYLGLSCVQNPAQYYVFRNEFLRAHHLKFEPNLLHEDALFTPTSLFFAASVVRLAHDCYVYNLREGSITTSGNNFRSAADMIIVVKKLTSFYKRHATSWRDASILSRYTAVAIGAVYYYWKRLSYLERMEICKIFVGFSLIGPIFRSGKIKYFAALAHMLAYRNLKR